MNTQQLLEHGRSPYHAGCPGQYDLSASIASRHCGDTLTLYLKLAGNRITELWHTAQGCLVSQAATSWLCRWAEGRSVLELSQASEESFLTPLGPLTPMRRQCALLPLGCLQQVIEQNLLMEGHAVD